MAQIAKKIRVASNPRKSTAQKKRSKNVPKLTGKKKAEFLARMAKGRKSSHRNPAASNKKKKNPSTTAVVNPSKRKKARNPETLRALIGSPKSLVVVALSGLGSAVITRQLPQLILKEKNMGWKGYASNAAAGLAATYAAGKLAGPEAAKAALTGAAVILLDRVLTEQYSPLGQYLALSGSGDATATGTLGRIADGYYIHPTVIDAQGRPVIPHEVTDAAIAGVLNSYPQIAAPARPAGNGQLAGVQPASSRFRTRFASRF
jgi:hypothetical protein